VIANLLRARVLHLREVAIDIGLRLPYVRLTLRDGGLGLMKRGGVAGDIGLAWRSAASSGRGSMVKSRSPAFTVAPSGATCRSMKPSTRARTSTVFTASVWPTY
jgi:hypothetical protein